MSAARVCSLLPVPEIVYSLHDSSLRNMLLGFSVFHLGFPPISVTATQERLDASQDCYLILVRKPYRKPHHE